MRARSPFVASLLVVLATLLASACGSSTKSACIAGETRVCVGPGACAGGQACLADGSGFGACDCGSVDAGLDAVADAEAGTPAACTLPSTGDALARVSNLVPATGKLDVCLKPSSGATIGPIFGAAAGCADGLLYKDVSAAFHVPAGTYEVDLVRGGAGCAGAPLASVTGVAFDAGTTTNAIAMGDGATDFQVRALRESAPVTIASKLRFVHALDGAPAQDFGVASAPTTPAMLATLYASGVPFGATATPAMAGALPVDPNGYVDLTSSGATLSLARATHGQGVASDVVSRKLVARVGYAAFAIGKTDVTGAPNDPRFPTELLVCNELTSDGVYARCGNGAAADVSFDVVDTQLNGPFSPFESLRRPAMQGAINGLAGDVACVTEVWSEADKDAIVNAAKSKYPYAARFKADLTTVVDDATDQTGAVPPAPTTAACTGADAMKLESYLACVQANCATVAGSPTATLKDMPADCITSQCGAQAITLASSAPRCWDCATTSAFGRTSFAATKTACETDPTARYAFGGANGVLLLSRLPFDGTPEVVYLGATDFRVAMVRATVIAAEGARIDAWCTDLTTPAVGVTRTYVGAYGGGATDSDTAWKNELRLQIAKVQRQVAQRSGKRPAIVLGGWHAGPAASGIASLQPEAYDALVAQLPLALADGVAPSCTECADNPIVAPPGTPPGGASTWSNFAVLSGVPITDVRANQVLLRTPLVATPAGTSIPVSTSYGFRTVVRVR